MNWKKLKVQHIERLTDDAIRVDFLPMDSDRMEWDFKAGQYLNLRIFKNNEEIRRSYSLCSAPTDDCLSIGVKEVPGGKFSSFANQTLAVGDVIDATFPQGSFVNEQEAESGKSFVYIAAGSGITPILSMIESTLEKSPNSQVSLFYGNKNVRSIMFHEQLEALKNRFIGRFSLYHILSRQVQDSPLLSGRIDGDKMLSWNACFVDLKEIDSFYLCGPEPMILNVQNHLIEYGIPKNHIKFELFGSDIASLAKAKRQSELVKSDKDYPKVKVHLDGKDMEFEFGPKDDNVLDAALSRGADLPFACKGGVCCTCKARLKEGEVEMYVNYGLEPEEQEAGFVLTCQSYPKSAHVVIDFDDV